MLKKFYETIKLFGFKNKLIFLLSVITNLPRVLKEKTVLTMRFAIPMKIDVDGKEVRMEYFSEVPFYKYDYGQIISHIEKDSLLLDIGAHFGEVSYRYLRSNKGFAYLFEPNPYNAEVIKRQFLKENMKNFKLFNVGLGSKDKIDHMHLSNPLSYEGSINSDVGEKIRISVKKLDGLALPECERFRKIFIKIDVEGYEVETIKGMSGFLKKADKENRHVKMLVEIKSEQNLKEIQKILVRAFSKLKADKVTDEDHLFQNR